MDGPRISKVERDKYKTYLKKAKEYFNGIEPARRREEWNGALLSAIHCAISSCDAVSTWYIGERSTSIRHEDIVHLLLKSKAPGAQDKVRQVQGVLAVKTLVEYEAAELSTAQAANVIKQAERIYEWARAVLPKE